MRHVPAYTYCINTDSIKYFITALSHPLWQISYKTKQYLPTAKFLGVKYDT